MTTQPVPTRTALLNQLLRFFFLFPSSFPWSKNVHLRSLFFFPRQRRRRWRRRHSSTIVNNPARRWPVLSSSSNSKKKSYIPTRQVNAANALYASSYLIILLCYVVLFYILKQENVCIVYRSRARSSLLHCCCIHYAFTHQEFKDSRFSSSDSFHHRQPQRNVLGRHAITEE